MLSLLHMQEQTDEGRASESTDLDYASENVTKLFDDIDAIIHEVDMKGYETFSSMLSSDKLLSASPLRRPFNPKINT